MPISDYPDIRCDIPITFQWSSLSFSGQTAFERITNIIREAPPPEPRRLHVGDRVIGVDDDIANLVQPGILGTVEYCSSTMVRVHLDIPLKNGYGEYKTHSMCYRERWRLAEPHEDPKDPMYTQRLVDIKYTPMDEISFEDVWKEMVG